jgi:hypothetical protein
MPQGSWSSKRERQYEHVKDSEQRAGRSTKTAKRIAAATVNQQRARSGEAEMSSRSSTNDKSPPSGGGQRSHGGASARTKEQLYAEAKRRGIKGRSSMSKTQLQHALASKG